MAKERWPSLALNRSNPQTFDADPSGDPTAMSFHNLSVELLEKILSKLHYFDICNVKLVSGTAGYAL